MRLLHPGIVMSLFAHSKSGADQEETGYFTHCRVTSAGAQATNRFSSRPQGGYADEGDHLILKSETLDKLRAIQPLIMGW